MKETGIEGKIIFGGPEGNFSPLNNTENQPIIFKGGKVLDSIQIGDSTYGGKGGNEQGRAVLPADGSFTLTKIQSKVSDLQKNSQCINYFEATVNGVSIKVGTQDSMAATLSLNMKVTLSGINAGNYIDSLQFNIVQ